MPGPHLRKMALRSRVSGPRETIRLYARCRSLLRRGIPSRSVVKALSAHGHDEKSIIALCREAYRELRRGRE